MDAGTDNGLTFTSPNWATDPRGEVFAITSSFPDHPAASFNYPHMQKLPTIATYSVKKVKISFCKHILLILLISSYVNTTWWKIVSRNITKTKTINKDTNMKLKQTMQMKK